MSTERENKILWALTGLVVLGLILGVFGTITYFSIVDLVLR